MDWPTWDQAAVTAGICALAFLALRRSRPSRLRSVMMPTTLELTLMSSLYSVWRLARVLPLERNKGAIERARWINRVQHDLHFPTELSLQHLALRQEWLGRFLNVFYAVAHVPVLIMFMVWLFVRHRDEYPHWRNGLAWMTAFCVLIRFVRVAPPRFLPDLGYIDLASKYGLSVYGPVGTGVSDQFAAMPSIHVGWAAVVSLGIVATSKSRWRWLFLLHLIVTMLAVSATGNHWWLDGIVAIALLWIGLLLDTGIRRLIRGRLATVDGGDADYSLEPGASDDVALEPA
ncbi:MAG: phosphatase PAP2 family protein [Ilumatobacteraceae bacterium]